MAELSACSLEFSPRVKLTFTHDEVTNCLTTVAPREPVDHRYQALFFTRTTAPSKEAQVALLEATLAIETSVLLRHEICYLMGQSGSPAAIPTLRRILHAEDEDEVTRHEAAEALAALEAPGLLEDLQAYEASRDTLPLLADTCKLALEGLKRKEDARVCGCQNGEKIQGGRFITTDPAKGDPTASTKDIPRLEATLMDESLALFDRYEAAFTHELAFVLAQLEDEATAACLVAKLEDPCEHAVVRHEAAMALSAMDGSDAKAALLRNLKDPDPMVHESCKASLSTMAYWAAWEAEEARILGQP
jgi:deoxyhypusine monooxygenase